MAKLTGEIIKDGLHIFVAAWSKKTRELVPVELVVVTGEVELEGKVLHVVFASETHEKSTFGVSLDPKSNYDRYVVYLGDIGVRPFNYDDRCTQAFTSKEEVNEMLEMCQDRNPNFVCEDGSNKPSSDGFLMIDDGY